MLALPLALAGCGMPIGVTIASFVADAFSLATTDKTITDHGISAVTGEDCALWRGLKGENICTPPAEAKPVQLADSGPDGAAGTKTAEAPEAPEAAPDATPPAADATAPGKAPEMAETPPVAAEPLPPVDTSPLPEAVSAEPIEPAEPAHLAEAAVSPPPPPPATPKVASIGESVPPPPAPKAVPKAVAATEPAAPQPPAAPAPKPDVAETGPAAAPESPGGTFLVIASYARATDAERFARHQNGIKWLVLSGTAHGKRVYRVAVGPFAGDRGAAEKGRLAGAGFADVWALHQDHPDVVAGRAVPDQVAELD